MTDTSGSDVEPAAGVSDLEVHRDGVSLGGPVSDHEAAGALGAVIRVQLVNALADVSSLSSPSTRQLLREWLGAQYRQLDLRDHDRLRDFAIELVMRCANLAGGWAGLASALEMIADGDPACDEVLRCIEQLTALGVEPKLGPSWDKLRESLNDIPVRDVQSLVLDVTDGRVGVLPAYCNSAWATFVHLVGFNARPGDSIPPWAAFLWLVCERFTDEQTGGQSRHFLRRLASTWGSTDDLERTRARYEARESRVTRTGVVTIVVTPDAADLDAFTLYSVQRWNDDASAPVRGPEVAARGGTLADQVMTLVQRAEESWAAQPADLRVEFVLPLSLINEPVEWWPKYAEHPATPLAVEHQVVVRSLERMRSPGWHRVWLQRWQQLQTSATARPFWVEDPGREDHARRLFADLRSDHDYVAVVLSRPPGPLPEDSQEIVVALRAGIPVIVWDRGGDDMAAVKRLMADLVSDLKAVPATTNTMRGESERLSPAERDRLPVRRISLLWDDADPSARMAIGNSPAEESR